MVCVVIEREYKQVSAFYLRKEKSGYQVLGGGGVGWGIATLEARVLENRNCFWDRYWGRAGKLLANFFPVPSNGPKRLCGR